MVTRKTTSTQRANAIKNGWRSGLEEKVANALTEAGVPFTYEKFKIKYFKEDLDWEEDEQETGNEKW